MRTNGFQFRACVVGETESGKSEFLASLIDTAADMGPTWVIDPLREHRIPKGGVRIGADPAMLRVSDGPLFSLVDEVCAAACQRGGITVVLEEAHLAMQGVSRKGARRAPPRLVDIARRGRHMPEAAPEDQKNPVGFVLCTQLPGDIDAAVMAMVRDWFCYRITAPNDLEALRMRGQDIRTIRELPAGVCLHSGRDWRPHLHTSATAECPDDARRV